jgi:GAF domain
MLAQMTQRLCAKRTFEDVIQTILDDAIALHGAEYGNVQLPIGDELAIAAQRSLSAAFLKTFLVKQDDGCACGRALRLGTTVIIADVEKDPEFAAFRIDAKLAGFCSVQSTSFFTKCGNLLGLVSTHFAPVHEPTPIEIETLKVYGVVAADYVFKLLGDVTLATKAQQMSEKLDSDILDHQDFRLPLVSAPPTFAVRGQY